MASPVAETTVERRNPVFDEDMETVDDSGWCKVGQNVRAVVSQAMYRTTLQSVETGQVLDGDSLFILDDKTGGDTGRMLKVVVVSGKSGTSANAGQSGWINHVPPLTP
jgi:hypothetical protein